MILLVIWSANDNGSALTSKACSKFNFLQYFPMGLCDHNLSSFRQIEQDVHYITYISMHGLSRFVNAGEFHFEKEEA